MSTPLKQARKKKAVPLATVASAVGVSAAHVSMLENMRVGCSTALAGRLVEYFGRDVITEEQILYPERFLAEQKAA